MPGTFRAGDSALNKMGRVPAFMELIDVLLGETDGQHVRVCAVEVVRCSEAG